jgi:hypothetical protein
MIWQLSREATDFESMPPLARRVGIAFQGEDKRDVVTVCAMLIAFCLKGQKNREEALEVVIKTICQLWD